MLLNSPFHVTMTPPTARQCPNPEKFVATRSCPRLRHMAAADALVASATLVLGSRSDKTAKLPQVIDALYKEFGKDKCKRR